MYEKILTAKICQTTVDWNNVYSGSRTNISILLIKLAIVAGTDNRCKVNLQELAWRHCQAKTKHPLNWNSLIVLCSLVNSINYSG